jgi:hypothetical protein
MSITTNREPIQYTRDEHGYDWNKDGNIIREPHDHPYEGRFPKDMAEVVGRAEYALATGDVHKGEQNFVSRRPDQAQSAERYAEYLAANPNVAAAIGYVAAPHVVA